MSTGQILTYPDRAAWESSRREPGAHFIGASEIAAIVLGCGPVEDRDAAGTPKWCDAFDLWRSHQPGYTALNRAELDDGNAWEPLALRLYDPPAGLRLVVSPLSVAVHPCGWLRATPDAWLVHRGATEGQSDLTPWMERVPLGLVEIKTDRHRDADSVWTATEIREFADGEPIGMPGHYWLQVQAQLACTGAPWCDVVAWLPRFSAMPEQRRVRVYPSERWPFIFAAVEAWRARYLVGDDVPEAYTREQVEHAQRLAYPSPTVSRAGTPREAELIGDCVEAQAGIKRLDGVVEDCRRELAASRGDAQRVYATGIGTYTINKRGAISVTAWKE